MLRECHTICLGSSGRLEVYSRFPPQQRQELFIRQEPVGDYLWSGTTL